MISIIIPLYNKAPYIQKALDSVCAQTYQDWECIIMDDGSTDDSAAVAGQWLKNNCCRCGSCYRLLSQPNAGVSAARNNAVLKSSGEFLCFLDADDWWEPTFLEEMVRFAGRVPEAGIWASNYVYYKPGKTRVGVTNVSYLDREKGIINYPRSYYQGTGMPIWTGAVLMQRSIFNEFGGFPLGVCLGEDFLLWARVALRYPVAFFDKPLAYYNNVVPSSLRATRNLHDPHTHMLFKMEDLENMASSAKDAEEWKLLFDKLRINGLWEYWLDACYHDQAAEELQKVNWSQFPSSVQRPYLVPVWQQRLKGKIMMLGSSCKQKIIRVLGIR